MACVARKSSVPVPRALSVQFDSIHRGSRQDGIDLFRSLNADESLSAMWEDWLGGVSKRVVRILVRIIMMMVVHSSSHTSRLAAFWCHGGVNLSFTPLLVLFLFF